jgi:hypothetical protein
MRVRRRVRRRDERTIELQMADSEVGVEWKRGKEKSSGGREGGVKLTVERLNETIMSLMIRFGIGKKRARVELD